MTKQDVTNAITGLAFAIITVGMVAIYLTILSNRQRSTQNTAYVRVQNCILSIPATSRTEGNIDHCYAVVEHSFNTKLIRYDKL